jgi:hypothetical protein
MSSDPSIRIRRVGQRRTWPFFILRGVYDIVIEDDGHEVFAGRTMTPSSVLVSTGRVHTTDSYDWLGAADRAHADGDDAWVTDPYGGFLA